MDNSALGTLGRRIIAWVVLIALAVLALKVVVGIVAGLVQAVVWTLLLVAVVVAGVWALRRA